ncbi:NYN domain-containing protein [cf. Phormidesmis sp. LEGE 11477]|uniref:NYN domain-containing protein n=1 Tax=cf. Phormidesmis sp. LEGE 11477 TaxID=1828680 RepID=UPI001880B901|nr:NYN domain-containing protein [cf. Phormidesmis sp. LEGE 11477]MBE9063022.1 NYN domain-containing protein [cf. Phormidesmis sp. LEGE 11477]
MADSSSQPISQAILLVDGYNIIGAWADLIHIRDAQGLDSARERLLAALANYSAYQEYETWAVFDAYEQPTPASKDVITEHLSVHYTGFGQTADSYIERACARFRNDVRKFTKRLIVATSDNVHRQTVIGYGAEGISALQLQNEVTSITQRVQHRQKSRKKRSARFIASLDPDTQNRLRKLSRGDS